MAGITNALDRKLSYSGRLKTEKLNREQYTTDPNYINEPNYVDPNAFLNWNSICDLNEDYAVDLADLSLFCEDNPQNWLWEACWHEDYSIMYGMSGGGESMMMVAPAFYISPTMALDPQFVEEKSIQDQILDLEDCIELLEKVWLEDPYIQQEIDPYDWKEFMDAVYESLFLMKAEGVQKQ